MEQQNMSGTDTRNTTQLFNDWRQGDAHAGQAMAQRFADWYYAITTSRLGEGKGRGPCDHACQLFGEGIVNVTEPRNLVPWAYEIVLAELENAGMRQMDGDEPNGYTGEQHPKELLCRAREALPAEVKLLEETYSRRAGNQEVQQLDLLGVLKARYRVKQWLRDNAEVPFDVAPSEPNLDRAPLPLYESGRMATDAEEANFEQWMLSDIDLCKDIAEFAHFSIALRGGLPTPRQFARQGEGALQASENRGCLARLFGG